jgi:enoyl-CoA hydratase
MTAAEGSELGQLALSGSGYRHLIVTGHADGSIVRITLNRPRYRNAQHRPLLIELDDAFRRAEADDRVRVVILAGAGTVFSSGHDMGSPEHLAERDPGPEQHITRRTNGGSRGGAERRTLQEWHYFFQNTLRWRNLRKITIAQVHGPVYSAGLMLAWACDLIIAAEGTTFADVVATRLGMCGVEYFAHPWEFGPRKTKELLLTGDSVSAGEAHALGMVSKIFPADQLAEQTLAFAARIARLPTVTALLVKESVNQTVDIMGFSNALSACFTLHQLNHAHWAEVTGGARSVGTPEFGVPAWRDSGRVWPSVPDRPSAEEQ